jgi:hypothetical protein
VKLALGVASSRAAVCHRRLSRRAPFVAAAGVGILPPAAAEGVTSWVDPKSDERMGYTRPSDAGAENLVAEDEDTGTDEDRLPRN